MAISLKRAYDSPSESDGLRILVDRLWPRGISKEAARIDLWLRDLAPSTELRRWFHSRPAEWQAFRKRYLAELNSPQAVAAVDQLYRAVKMHHLVTLVYSSKTQSHNNAVVLKEMLEGMRKPPSTTGPSAPAARARAGKSRPRLN